MDTIKQDYSELIKKYKLPSFERLDEEFEIRALEENKSGRPIKAILRLIANKLRSFLESLDSLINPNPSSLYSMMIINNINEELKKEIFDFYIKVGSLYQKCFYYELESDEKTAEFIKSFWKEWPELKEKQKRFLKTVMDNWEKEPEKKKAGYHG